MKMMETTGEDPSVSGESAASASLSGLPPSIICFGVSQFLPVKDILSMSQTCRVFHRSIIPDPKKDRKKVESTTQTAAAAITASSSSSSSSSTSQRDDNILLWEKILERDFGLTFGSFGVPDKNSVYVIPTQQDQSGVSNIAPQGMVLPVTSSIEAYKQWKKTSLKFYKGSDRRESYNVNAGYFIRAALMWQKIAVWCCRNGEFGAQLLNTFLPGIRYVDVVEIEEEPQEATTAAIRAICSFCKGQNYRQRQNDSFFFSLLGVYNAYDFVTLNYFYDITSNTPQPWFPSWLVAISSVVPRALTMDIKTGRLSWRISPQRSVQATSHTGTDRVLIWFEEYVRRLTNDIYRVGAIQGSYVSTSHKGINLYPWPCLGETGEEDSITGPLVSRRVTKGIEVIASAVWAPQLDDIGFVYSIRMRLLEEGQDGYVSPQERGFATAQLVSRHWKIYNKANDRTDFVNGDGVIGMVPILEDGGYREPGLGTGEFTPGWFIYQSCTGSMVEGGHFSGHITFRTINTSGQHFFDVEVGEFKLDAKPEFLY